MRILCDTNTLLSSLLFPNSTTAKALTNVLTNHRLVLCSYVIEETKLVLKKKFPEYVSYFDIFLEELDYEYVVSPTIDDNDITLMRDPKDVPILLTAIEAGVDLVLTGDKDFLSLNIKNPKMISSGEYLKGIHD